MGRWCQVQCSCPNRALIDPGDDRFYRCGHFLGLLIGTPPNAIVTLGRVLDDVFTDDERLFPVFRSIPAWLKTRCLVERLRIAGELLDQWQGEAGALRHWMEWGRSWNPDMLVYFERVLQPNSEQLTGFYHHLKNQLAALETHLSKSRLDEALDRADALCDASRASGNPVEFIY